MGLSVNTKETDKNKKPPVCPKAQVYFWIKIQKYKGNITGKHLGTDNNQDFRPEAWNH